MATDEAPPSASSPGRRWRRGVPACFPRSCGVASLAVRPRPRIGLLISGDELVSAGEPRGPGGDWESNGTLLEALTGAAGPGGVGTAAGA